MAADSHRLVTGLWALTHAGAYSSHIAAANDKVRSIVFRIRVFRIVRPTDAAPGRIPA